MIFLLLSVFVVWFCVPKQVRAAQNIAQTEASQQEELLSDLPLSDIQKVLEQNTDTQDLTFRELVRQLMQDGEYTVDVALEGGSGKVHLGMWPKENSCLYKYCF